MSDIDNDKLGALVGKMLGDLGGAFSVPTVRIGFRLGLFDALHRHGAARISELADRTGLAERYVREWAFAQATNGYIAFDAEQERFSLTPEQAMVFANKDSPVYLEGAFDLASAIVEGQSKVESALPDMALLGGRVPVACSAPSARSSGRATSTASSSLGYPHWTVSCQS